ncbi:MAG TPA: quercetin 2,3-dioxygenase, partial [Urbifossiella sp.]|nr:quercetin 2,3-dioxygenase [Urbifossiella sp.]
EPAHFLQIWLMPDRKGHTPGYRQKAFPAEGAAGRWQLVASPDGADGSLSIHQDARLYQTRLEPGRAVRHALAAGRGAFVHVATGAATVNGQTLAAGDAVKVEGEPEVVVTGTEPATVLLFDLA